eukprot:GEMP01005592.1.p1 GENE.GEMP01005592.1~~GEMP01005592.1.p1  ORF type:complete len:868 (+),score=212.85 GEMP01005592.1:446-3049(+)
MIRFALIVVALCNYDNANTAPVTKIAESLGNLLQSVNEEGQLDQQNYQEFYRWCQQTFEIRKRALNGYKAIEQELQSKLMVQLAMNKQLKDETMQLQQEGAEAKQAMQQAALLRQNEHADYIHEQKNLAGMLQMLNHAVEVLGTSTSPETLVSVGHIVQQLAAKSNLVSDSQRDQLSMFVRRTQNTRGDDTINDAASVNQVLKELINQFQSTMSNASTEEKQADEQFAQLIGLKKQSFTEYVTSKDAKDAISAESLQRTTQYQRALQDAQAVVQSVDNYLKTIQSLCVHKSKQWAGRAQVRQDIMAATQSVISQLGATQEVVQVQNVPQRVAHLDQQAEISFALVGNGQTLGAARQNGAFTMNTANDHDGAVHPAPSFLQISAGLDMQVPPSLKFSTENTMVPTSTQRRATATAADIESHAALQMSSMTQVSTATADIESHAALQTNSMTQAGPTSMDIQADFNMPQVQKANTYSAVRKMVGDMAVQLQAQNDDEERHKRWCSNEISKNTAVQKDKDAKVQRLSTKIDNERQMAQELDQDLELLSKEIAALNQDVQSLQSLKIAERANYSKFAKKHQMANHIVSQAANILQRVTSLPENRGEGQVFANSEKGFNYGGFLAPSEISTVPLAAIDSLSHLLTLYEELRTNSDKAENQSVVDFEQYVNLHKNVVAVLTQTKNYKQSLRLQAMAELDNDREDATALTSQTGSVHAYVQHLRQACKDILEHYGERRARRERNLRALQQAGEVINIDNADEVHHTLTTLAQTTDNEAAQLLGNSAQITGAGALGGGASASPWSNVAHSSSSSGSSNTASARVTVAPRVFGKNADEASSSADILRDLRSLQDMSDAAHSLQDSTNGLNMLPAMR